VPLVHVDFSVYSAYLAQGNVHGKIEIPSLPQVGEAVEFFRPSRPVPKLDVDGFTPRIVVEHVALPPEDGAGLPSLSLRNVKVTTSAEAETVFSYFENGFGLFADRFQENLGE
jgi:hypothetical protein